MLCGHMDTRYPEVFPTLRPTNPLLHGGIAVTLCRIGAVFMPLFLPEQLKNLNDNEKIDTGYSAEGWLG
jgi:hypothetical protein